MPDPKIAQTIAEAAVATERATACPAELLFAQCALESGWLKHAPRNNCFGIKATFPLNPEAAQLLATVEWMTPCAADAWIKAVPGRTAVADGFKQTNLTTLKGGRIKWNCQDWFAAFDTLAECFAARAQMVHGRYQPAFDAFKADHDLTKLIRGIAAAGYAQDDGTYADKLLTIISESPVQAAIANARVSTGVVS